MDGGEMEKHLLEEAKKELEKWEVRAPVGNIEIISAFSLLAKPKHGHLFSTDLFNLMERCSSRILPHPDLTHSHGNNLRTPFWPFGKVYAQSDVGSHTTRHKTLQSARSAARFGLFDGLPASPSTNTSLRCKDSYGIWLRRQCFVFPTYQQNIYTGELWTNELVH